jgi:hypothetical protein
MYEEIFWVQIAPSKKESETEVQSEAVLVQDELGVS